MKSLPPPSALGQANHFGNSDSEDSEEDDDEASASDDSEDFGDLASQMELGVSR